jgi:hypothetical protein
LQHYIRSQVAASVQLLQSINQMELVAIREQFKNFIRRAFIIAGLTAVIVVTRPGMDNSKLATHPAKMIL